MPYNPEIHHRHSIRLAGYDYSAPGYYFITVCTYNRASLFGELVNREMHLSEAGKLVAQIWNEMPQWSSRIVLDACCIMPDHFHGILMLTEKAGKDQSSEVTLGIIVGRFKSIIAARYCNEVKKNNWPPFDGHLWQRNYYERIIRNHDELDEIRRYIKENPENHTT